MESALLDSNLPFTNANNRAPQAELIRSPVLAGRSSNLGQLVRGTHPRQAGYGRLLASRRIPPVLDMAIPPAASGAAESGGRGTRLDPPHEKRESDVGRAAHPWRAAITRLRDLRAYPVTLSATPEAHSGAKQSQPVACFLDNHREVIAAFDFFTVPTLRFRTLYCFFAIEHDRRRILHFNVTFHPTSDWIVQQLREAFPLPCPYRYVLFDHDAKFGNDVFKFLGSSDLTPLRTSIRSPWQNGTAEPWVGSARRELLDYVIPLNECHFRRLGRAYIGYYHADRTHIALNKSTPVHRAIQRRTARRSHLICTPRLGGLDVLQRRAGGVLACAYMRRNRPALFRGRHFEAEIIVLCVRWYLRFGLSFRNLEE